MKYVATIHVTEQVSEDRWIYRPYTKEIDCSKPFSEVIEWAYSKFTQHERTRPGFVLPEIKITGLE
jgi:hypothetical protein